MRKIMILIGTVVVLTILFKYDGLREQTLSKKSLNASPADPTVMFTEAYTRLQLVDQLDKDKYSVAWLAFSDLNRAAHVRRDISLLYEDGRLAGKLSSSRENTEKIRLFEKVNSEDSGHFEAISVHHAEMNDPNDEVKSRQKMSYDQLYVTASPLGTMEAFEVPNTEEEKEWKHILNHATKQQLHYVWEDLLRDYHLSRNQFYSFPLPYLHVYNSNALPGLNQQETQQAIGKLWEQLYKNYFLGIQTKDEGKVRPIGSAMPLVLLDKQATQLLVLTQTADGEDVKIVQPLK